MEIRWRIGKALSCEPSGDLGSEDDPKNSIDLPCSKHVQLRVFTTAIRTSTPSRQSPPTAQPARPSPLPRPAATIRQPLKARPGRPDRGRRPILVHETLSVIYPHGGEANPPPWPPWPWPTPISHWQPSRAPPMTPL